MINSKQYGDFSNYYDVLMNDVDYNMWGSYINNIISKNGIKHKDILEMACGTGNMAVNMSKRGYFVTAFDISQEMLSVASHKAVINGTKINFLLQDMKDIKIKEQFGIVLCLCDSINYITKEEDLAKAFSWVYKHLKDDGIFIFDINSAYKLKEVIGNNTFTYNTDDIAYIWDNYLTEEKTVEFYLTFFVKEESLYRRFDEVHIEKIYEAGDIISMLRGQGFSRVQAVEGFSDKAVNDKSERINFIVRK
jgi:2-polyprenyl-3-methyl-5-hydroxy-6-metoxy-1,4-benzoquinol methylase